MKTVLYLLGFIGLMTSLYPAYASERTVASAQMIPAKGKPSSGTSYFLSWVEDSSLPNSVFLDLQVSQDPCNGNPLCAAPVQMQLSRYRVVAITSDRCSSQRLFAVAEKRIDGQVFLGFEAPVWTIVLEDSQKSKCLQPANRVRWLARFLDLRMRQLIFTGTPKVPEPPLDCEGYFSGMNCTGLYLPATCQWVDTSRPGQPNFSATRPNSCVATIKVLEQACGAGIDPRLIEDEVTCRVQCIIPDCAAPPEGCAYENPTYDPNGCLTSCGQMVCEGSGGPSGGGLPSAQ